MALEGFWVLGVLVEPAIIRLLVDGPMKAGDDGTFAAGAGGVAALLLGVFAVNIVIRALMTRWELRTSTRFSVQVVDRIRRDVFDHVQRLSMRYFDRTKQGRIIARADRDVDSTAFGSSAPSQLGTPGVSSGCSFAYTAQSIPVSFFDVSDGGTAVVNSPSSAVDGKTVAVTLAATASDPAPVTFGVRCPVLSVSLDGWLVPGSTTTTNYNNKSYPDSSTPVGSLAPFWDDLQTSVGTSEVYWKHVAAGEDPATPAAHWVFQWAHVRHYGTSPADDLNFQVKLFESGVIEYHYGAMTSGTPCP